MTQRDTFISELFEIAKKDKDVILISVDMGASALDRWRDELPEQFIWTGISEQHSINLAAGLSAAGKKVYVSFMAAWSSGSRRKSRTRSRAQQRWLRRRLAEFEQCAPSLAKTLRSNGMAVM